MDLFLCDALYYNYSRGIDYRRVLTCCLAVRLLAVKIRRTDAYILEGGTRLRLFTEQICTMADPIVNFEENGKVAGFIVMMQEPQYAPCV